MRQNYYVQLDGTGHVTDISDTFKQGYIPVAISLQDMPIFERHSKLLTYNSKLHAMQAVTLPSPVLGVSWNGSSNPQMNRTDGAVGMRAGINGNKNDFDNVAPYGYMEQTSDSKGNQYMVLPPFYVHRTQNGQTGSETLQICSNPQQGWYLPKCFIDPKTKSIHEIWIGKYLGNSNGTLASKSGQVIDANSGIDTYRIEMEANNPNNSQNGPYSLMDIHTWCALQDLFTVEFATLDSKAVFYNEQGDNIQIPTSQTALSVQQPNTAGTNDDLPGTSNWNSNAGVVNYRGIENIFGYDGTWCDGICGNNDSIGMDYTQYNDSGNGYQLLSYSNQAENATSGNSISQEGFDPNYQDLRIPVQQNGDSNDDNYYCNYSGVNGDPSVYVGGYGDAYANAVGMWSADADTSDASGVASARLVYHPLG